MKYFLRQMLTGKIAIIPIDAESYDELKNVIKLYWQQKLLKKNMI
ncbi:MAG: hypothetical protein ACJAYB_000930 [Psychromonas sp.]|jgi:hypothetical protein